MWALTMIVSFLWWQKLVAPGGLVIAAFRSGDLLLRLDSHNGGGMILVLPAGVRGDAAMIVECLLALGTLVGPDEPEANHPLLYGASLASFDPGDVLIREDCGDGGAVLRLPAGVRRFPEHLWGLRTGLISPDPPATKDDGNDLPRRQKAPETSARVMKFVNDPVGPSGFKKRWAWLVKTGDFAAMIGVATLLRGEVEAREIGLDGRRRKVRGA